MDIELISPIGIFTWTNVGVVSMAAVIGNGFIIAVNGNQCFQNKKMVPSNFLLTSLSISRILFHLTFVLGYILEVTAGDTYFYTSAQEVLNFTCIFSDMASLWCASWLSVFYCVKVTNFANRFLLWLKPRINVLSIRLLGISICSLMVFSVPFFSSYVGNKKSCNVTRGLQVNISHSKVCKNLFVIFRPFQFIFVSINFIIGITASILLLTSLWKHTKNMKKSGIHVKDLSAQIHINVMKPLLFYIFFYFLYFAGAAIRSSAPFHSVNAIELVSDILTPAFPSAHTIILILTNPKLKAQAAHALNVRQRVS